MFCITHFFNYCAHFQSIEITFIHIMIARTTCTCQTLTGYHDLWLFILVYLNLCTSFTSMYKLIYIMNFNSKVYLRKFILLVWASWINNFYWDLNLNYFSAGVPDFTKDIEKITTLAHSNHSLLLSSQSLQREIEGVLPELKQSVDRLRGEVEQEMTATPTQLRTTVCC